MRLPKIVLAGTAALALSLSLGACSMSVNGSGSGDSGSPAAQSEQKDTQGADSKGSAKTDAKGAATADSQSSSGGSAQTTAAPGTKDDDKDDDKDGDDAPITDPTWKDIQSTGQRTEVSGAYTVQGAGTTVNLVGDLDALTVQGSDVKISADKKSFSKTCILKRLKKNKQYWKTEPHGRNIRYSILILILDSILKARL